MNTWRFYNVNTGVFLPRLFTGSASTAAINTPTDCALIPADGIDPMCQCVDVSVLPPDPVFNEQGQDISPPWYPPVIDYIPPAPADDAMQTWAWDAGIKRWVSTPTLAAHKKEARQRIAAAWNEARAAGVTLGTKTAPTDADSWTRYLAIKEMAADGGWVDVPIPLADGSFELMTQAKMVTLWGALKSMERTLLARLRDRIESINAATTQAEVEAVVW